MDSLEVLIHMKIDQMLIQETQNFNLVVLVTFLVNFLAVLLKLEVI